MKQIISSILCVAIATLFMTSCSKVEPYAIYYTTSNDTKISIENVDLNDIIVEHTYKEGKGVIVLSPEATSIVEKAFWYCEFITSVTIPDSVTKIGDSAFHGCSRLTSVTIGDSVTTIGGGAFYGCSSLTSVTIPDSVTTIGDTVFSSCSSLTSVTIPDSVTKIGEYAFSSCKSLTSVTIPDSVTTIGEEAFCACSNLTTLVIGSNVKEIGYYAFGNCSNLSDVYCKALVPPITVGYAFDYNSSFSTIYVPTESVEAYKSAKWWSDYKSSFEGYNFQSEVTPSFTLIPALPNRSAGIILIPARCWGVWGVWGVWV